MRLPARGLRRLRADTSGDEGITLLEVIVSLLIIAVVMSAAAGFFINGLRQTGGQSSRQQAIVITDQWLERVNSLAPSSLLTGRTLTAVTALLATDTGGVLTGRDDTSNTSSLDYDPNAATAPAIALPTSQTVTTNNQKYLVRIFVDPCWLPTGTATSTNTTKNLACVSTSTAAAAVAGATGSTAELRATVATSWTGVAGTNCAGGCLFDSSTIIDPKGDPTFNSNISKPTLASTSPIIIGGNGSKTITLVGTGFVYGATVTATCDTCTVTVGTVNQATNTGLSIQVPITVGPTTGQVTFRLTNPDGGTAIISMTVTAPPAVTSYTPSVAAVGSLTSVSFTGTNLSAATTVTASGGTVGLVTYSGGTLTFTYLGSSSTPSPVFTLTNPDGGTTTVSGITVKTPTLSYVNDTSSQISYSSAWFYSSGRSVPDYQTDVHAVASTGATATFTFTGVSVAFLTEYYSDEGAFSVSLDGGAPTVLTGYTSGARVCQVTAWSASGLVNGPHTVTVTALSNSFTLVDAFQIGTVS